MTNNLRESYLEAVKAASPRKELVSKSAIGPRIYAVRNSAGQVISYAPGESVSPNELLQAMGKDEVAKSATAGLGKADGLASELPDDPNAIFDDVFDHSQSSNQGLQPIGVLDVQKSAVNSGDDDLTGIFPVFLRPQ